MLRLCVFGLASVSRALTSDAMVAGWLKHVGYPQTDMGKNAQRERETET